MDIGLSVTVRLGEVETVEYQRDRGMGVTVYFGKRKGAASTADLTERALRETVAKACSIARYTAEDSCAGLAGSRRRSRPTSRISTCRIPGRSIPRRRCELARACEAAAMAVDTRITNSEGAGVSSHRGVRVYGNSHGFLGRLPGTLHSMSCVVLGVDGDEMQRDYWYSTYARLARARIRREHRPPERRTRRCTARRAQARHDDARRCSIRPTSRAG